MVAINRAVAIAETRGPAAGLAALDLLKDDPQLASYQPYWAARAGLLGRTDALVEADRAYELAAQRLKSRLLKLQAISPNCWANTALDKAQKWRKARC